MVSEPRASRPEGMWWNIGIKIDVGCGSLPEALGLMVSLPASAAHAVTFTLVKDLPAFQAGLLGTLDQLGGVPEGQVFDTDTAIVASRQAARPACIWRLVRCSASWRSSRWCSARQL